MLHLVKNLRRHAATPIRDALGAGLALTLCAASAQAEGAEPSPETQARDLAVEVMRGAGDGDLGTWTREIVDRALERAGEAARDAASETGPAALLPAERHAARVGEGLAARPSMPELLVFMSLSVPPASWKQWAREAALLNAPLVLRGVGDGGLRATVEAVGERLGGAEAGVAIDPRLFRLFGIERVPAVVVIPGGAPPCTSRGCAGPGSGSGAGFPAPPHDLVTGNIGLAAALEAVAAEGEAGRDAARRVLERLEGDTRAVER
ncbi:MAG: type-F conjugative transfer system pilin assembly protein TrbC [Rhodospirillales bacterium]|nr:type-F conjugative transfer system pilin assembly protein TrbC [Rhodospirillales bacterium]